MTTVVPNHAAAPTAEQKSMARLRVTLDRRLGEPTPQWIKDIAESADNRPLIVSSVASSAVKRPGIVSMIMSILTR